MKRRADGGNHNSRMSKSLVLATCNAKSLSTQFGYFAVNNLESLASFCDKHRVDALALQEHSLSFKDSSEVKEIQCRNYCLIATSANAAGSGGVAWFLKSQLRNTITKICAVNPRVLHLTLTTEMHTMQLLSCYAPTAMYPTERDVFFSFLSNYVQDEAFVGLKFVLGDFNSILQQDEHHTYGHVATSEITEDAADQFSEFLTDTELLATSGIIRNYTRPFSFRRANTNEKVLLDYVLINYSSRVFLQTNQYPGRPTTSDHWPVIAIFALPSEPTAFIKRPVSNRPDCRPLIATHTLFSAETQEKFAEFVTSNIPVNPKIEDYAEMVRVFEEASQHFLPVKERAGLSELAKRDKVVDARERFESHEHDAPIAELRTLYNQIISARHDEYTQDADDICKQFSALQDSDPYTAYQKLKQITGSSRSNRCVKGKTPKERMESIANTCRQQLTNTIGNPDISFQPHVGISADDFNSGPFVLDELNTAVTLLRNNKSPGPDNVYPEFLKLPSLQPQLLFFFNDVFTRKTTPNQMRETVFVMLPKPGANLTEPSGWRYIALMSYMAKLYDILLRERLRIVIEPHLRYNQNGFRHKKSTQQHILALEFIINAFKQQDKPVVLTFIDFKNAFPSVQWYAIRAALQAFNVPHNLIDAVLSMYRDHKGYVRTRDGDTEKYLIEAGVLQGDTLAPYLFVIVLNEIMKKTMENMHHSVILECFTQKASSRHFFETICVTDLDFADDIVLINNNPVDAQNMLLTLEREANLAGMEINPKKTQNIVIGLENVQIFSMTGKPIENVTRYRYLGRWTDVAFDLTVRIGSARSAMAKMQRIWKSTSLSNKHKAQLFKIFILPKLTYAMCTYPLSRQILDRIRGATTRMLKKAFNIEPQHHSTIEELYQHGDVIIELAPVHLFRARMNLIGDALRNPETILSKLFMICHDWSTYNTTINTTITEFLEEDVSPSDLRKKAQNKQLWQNYIDSKVQVIHQLHMEQIKERSANARLSAKPQQTATTVNSHVVRQTILDNWLTTNDKPDH